MEPKAKPVITTDRLARAFNVPHPAVIRAIKDCEIDTYPFNYVQLWDIDDQCNVTAFTGIAINEDEWERFRYHTLFDTLPVIRTAIDTVFLLLRTPDPAPAQEPVEVLHVNV